MILCFVILRNNCSNTISFFAHSIFYLDPQNLFRKLKHRITILSTSKESTKIAYDEFCTPSWEDYIFSNGEIQMILSSRAACIIENQGRVREFMTRLGEKTKKMNHLKTNLIRHDVVIIYSRTDSFPLSVG